MTQFQQLATPSPLERVGERSDLVLTSDGSHTLFAPALDECYHSTHGAIQESRHIFIEDGMKQCAKSDISVLEIGFGTGLNAFLTLLEAAASSKTVRYTSLELYPVEVKIALQLNYPEALAPDKRGLFELMHETPWNSNTLIGESLSLLKVKADYTNYEFQEKYDLVYFDAFSPDKQPEMWTEERFKILYDHCNPGAILTTYCSKGVVRRAMQGAGFTVERLPGPPGKRQILRAVK
jgi:tRNA U34 5-methylaminomethyl-2-thiouridine-forming methyltransferase MnmC